MWYVLDLNAHRALKFLKLSLEGHLQDMETLSYNSILTLLSLQTLAMSPLFQSPLAFDAPPTTFKPLGRDCGTHTLLLPSKSRNSVVTGSVPLPQLAIPQSIFIATLRALGTCALHNPSLDYKFTHHVSESRPVRRSNVWDLWMYASRSNGLL